MVVTNLPKSVHFINWGYLGYRGTLPPCHTLSYPYLILDIYFLEYNWLKICLVGVFGVSGVKNCVFVL